MPRISEIGGPTACSYDPRQEAALFSQSKVEILPGKSRVYTIDMAMWGDVNGENGENIFSNSENLGVPYYSIRESGEKL